MTTLKLVSPLKIWNGYDEDLDEPIMFEQQKIPCFRPYLELPILGAIKKYNDSGFSGKFLMRGLMAYYGEHDDVNAKVLCAHPTVEFDDDHFIGVCHCVVDGVLTDEEKERLVKYISGQYSDGWGEGFEQRDIPTKYGTIHVSFWDGSPEWKIDVIDPRSVLSEVTKGLRETLDILKTLKKEEQSE